MFLPPADLCKLLAKSLNLQTRCEADEMTADVFLVVEAGHNKMDHW